MVNFFIDVYTNVHFILLIRFLTISILVSVAYSSAYQNLQLSSWLHLRSYGTSGKKITIIAILQEDTPYKIIHSPFLFDPTLLIAPLSTKFCKILFTVESEHPNCSAIPAPEGTSTTRNNCCGTPGRARWTARCWTWAYQAPSWTSQSGGSAITRTLRWICG